MIIDRTVVGRAFLALAASALVAARPLPQTDDPKPTSPADSRSQPVAGELLLHNAVVLTMDDSQPSAQAVLIRGDRIGFVGTDADARQQAAPETPAIDLQGRVLVPGFIDSHNHRLGDYPNAGFSSPEAVIAAALSQGWTTLHELFASETRLQTLRDLDNAGQLHLRVNAYLPVNSPEGEPYGEWYGVYRQGEFLSPRVRVAGLKIFADGDWGRNIYWTQDDLSAFIRRAYHDGWQIAIKTISAQTLELVLSALSDALDGQSDPAFRLRVEHALSVTADQMIRMRELGVIASIQPNMPGELVGDPELALFVEREPAGAVTPWRDLVAAGVVIAGGSAWPSYYAEEPSGAPFGSPLRLLFQARTRVGNLGASPEPWMLDQAITVEQALRSLTVNGAFAALEETGKGSLAPGKLADLVLLSANPLAVPVEQIPAIQVLMTMIGGQVVWCAPEAADVCPPAEAPASATPETSAAVLSIPTDQPLRIALVAPMTGEHAAMGQGLEQALRLAIEDRGPVHNRPVEIVAFDDTCSAEMGAVLAQQIVTDGRFVAVIGPACSGPASQALPIFEQAQIPVISPAATSPDLTSLGPLVFNRTVLDDAQLASAGLDVAYVEALPAVQELYSRYEQRAGALPSDIYRPFIAYAYDALMILLNAIEQTATPQADGSLSLDRLELARAVRATGDYPGVTGLIRFDAQGNRVP